MRIEGGKPASPLSPPGKLGQPSEENHPGSLGQSQPFSTPWRLLTLAVLLLLVLLALAVRLPLAVWDTLYYPDSTEYLHLAQEIKEGALRGPDFDLDHGFNQSRRRPPLYPFLVALFSLGGSSLEKTAVGLSLALSLLALLPFYFSAVLLFRRQTAIAATLLFSLHPALAWYSSAALTEPLFLALYLAAFACATQALLRPQLLWFAGSGLLSALLLMTREAGIVAPFILTAAAGLNLFRRGERRAPHLLRLAVLWLSFLLAAAPYLFHIRLRTGHFGISAQMTPRGILRLLSAGPGDTSTRDRFPLRLPGDAEALSQLQPPPAEGAVKAFGWKTLSNLESYGLAFIRLLGPLLFVFLLWGLRREAEDEGRAAPAVFPLLWPLLWMIPLWLLYAILSPFMVEARYMLPLVPFGLMLAAAGLDRISRGPREFLSAFSDGKKARLLSSESVLLFALGVVLVLFFPALRLPENAELTAAVFSQPGRAEKIYAAAALPLMLPGFIELAARRRRGRVFPLLAAGASLIVAGSILLGRPGEERAWLLGAGLAGAVLVAAGGGVILAALSVQDRTGQRAAVLFRSLLLMAVLFGFTLEWLIYREECSPAGRFRWFSAGAREAAEEIKHRGLIPPGKVIAAAKPFLSYYLGGRWYIDRERLFSLPEHPAELSVLIQNGMIDFLALDTYSLRTLKPALTSLALGREPLPGTRLLYSRYFEEYQRIITVYDCQAGTEAESPPVRGELSYARELFAEDRLVEAEAELKEILARQPDNLEAWVLHLRILDRFYQCVRRDESTPILLLAPSLLPELIRTAENCVRLSPDDPSLRALLHRLDELARQEKALLEQRRKERSGTSK